jgi:hypothetical protein
VEEGITADIQMEGADGTVLELPAKSYSDLVTRNRLGEIEVIDHKFVSTYTDGSVDDFKHWLQGMFNYHTIKAKYGEAPKRIIFMECKLTRNKDATPQIQPYTIEFGSPSDFATFYRLYHECTKLLNLPGMVFLPNPNDMFDGQNTFEVFRSGVIGVERPEPVKHKTEMVAFTEKRFVPSVHEEVPNQSLSFEERIRLKLQEFGIPVEMAETYVGASITRYTMRPSRGVSMAKVAKMDRDLALALEARSLRIEAPIPGTNLIGVEVPSATRRTVELAESHLERGTLRIPVGVDVRGELVSKDLADMPHLLIAGATGAGKSVMLNVIITALTQQLGPEALQLVLVDPKRVELAQFKSLPHLLLPLVYEDEEAVATLDLMTEEMDKRYVKLESAGVRNIEDYNRTAADPLPKIVVIIDEFADLMMTSEDRRSERAIVRIAQKARAVGIHLILATQRPSADVVTGLIKANIPTKIAFMTTSKVNSQVILDATGAEELTGKGDMLFMDPSHVGLQRLQGLYK